MIENLNPETYKNVKVFAAGKYVSPSNAWIRNLQVSTYKIITLKNTDTEKGDIFIIYF